MKNTLKIFIAAAIVVLAITGNAKARPNIINTSNETRSLISLKNNDEKRSNVSSAINTRALKSFQKQFKNATDVSWYAADKGYIASFTKDDIKTFVDYDRRGTWNHTIRYYDEKKLPTDIRYRIKSYYIDYEIAGVIEVNVNDKTVYMIYLQDQAVLKTIRICDGEMEEIGTYMRS
jgi:hypothetical protein